MVAHSLEKKEDEYIRNQLSIPKDVIKTHILKLSNLNMIDILNFGQTCKELNKLVKDSIDQNTILNLEKFRQIVLKEAIQNAQKKQTPTEIDSLKYFHDYFYSQLEKYTVLQKKLIKEKEPDLDKQKVLLQKLAFKLLFIFEGYVDATEYAVFDTLDKILKYPHLSHCSMRYIIETVHGKAIRAMNQLATKLVRITFNHKYLENKNEPVTDMTIRITLNEINKYVHFDFAESFLQSKKGKDLVKDKSHDKEDPGLVTLYTWQMALIQTHHSIAMNAENLIENLGNEFEKLFEEAVTEPLPFHNQDSFREFLQKEMSMQLIRPGLKIIENVFDN